MDLNDMWRSDTMQMGYVFPNWVRVPMGSFDVWVCDAATCGPDPEVLVGLTVVNYGTAVPGTDIKAVYWQVRCGAVTALYTMTYDGAYTEDSGTYPAWTWEGATADLSTCGADLCACLPACCGETFTIDLYMDVAPCPATMVTASLGFPVNQLSDTTWGGSVSDDDGTFVPWGDLAGPSKTFVWAYKEANRPEAAPGDTVTFTITYGRAGTGPLTSIVVVDTLPAYTHYVGGSAAPAPDIGWDPDTGPPPRLRWTIPGPIATTGGPTAQLTFGVTVDWGNGEAFEPGSGDVAAPEGVRLNNQAQVHYPGSGCAPPAFVMPPVSTLVRRYLFWLLGDNDVLFAGQPGIPDDEIIYEIYVKNLSPTKTWWNVSIWDTVPAQLNPWGPGFGFEDPCTGWTMTPSGCAAATPGAKVAGGTTLLTWKLDMPPGLTMSLRWKAVVPPTVPSGSTAVNKVSVLELGRIGVANGTGHAQKLRAFAHAAPIVLRTTYVSYVADGCSEDNNGCGLWICFYPLNKVADFELRGLEYNTGWSTYPATGGVSASIGSLLGSCVSGLGCPGSGGCKAERSPAHYSMHTAACAPNSGEPTCPVMPLHYLYKLTSNSPCLWTVYHTLNQDYDDAQTFTPSSSLSFSGLIHYTFLRHRIGATDGDAISIVNTGLTADGVYDPTLATTALLFQWDPVSLSWQNRELLDIGPESQWSRAPVSTIAEEGHWRIISSIARLIIHQSGRGFGLSVAQNLDSMTPNRETGAMVSGVAGAGNDYTFYIFPGNEGTDGRVFIGNTGTVQASYRIDRYIPDNPLNKPLLVPSWLADSSGQWFPLMTDAVNPGLVPGVLPEGNPHVYGSNYDGSYLFTTSSAEVGLWRIVHLSGGPIQMMAGSHVLYAAFGATMVHAADGGQVGKEFWVQSPANFTATLGKNCNDKFYMYGSEFFCPRTGMAVRAVSNDGYSASYTTNGPDQCVTFRGLTQVLAGAKRNLKVSVLGSGAQGNMIGMFNGCLCNQKFFTAPFLAQGVHYTIIAPPVVFTGQAFWITVIVQDTAGDSKTDYCGTSSFTSTDPSAKMEGSGMDLYSYTWDSNDPGATCVGAGCVGGCDNGVKLFFSVIMSRLGLQSLVAQDTMDGSITGLTAVNVVGADVKLFKEPRLMVAASGDTARFKICWSNYSSASAFTFVVTDAVPVGTDFIPEGTTAAFDCGNTDGVAPSVSYSTSTSVTMPPAASFATANPVAGSRWLRWTIPSAGVQTSGCVCFRVKVN